MVYPNKPQHIRRVYLDHAATTPLESDVLAAMQPYLREQYGNPSALYTMGRVAKRAIDAARTQVSAAIGAQPDTIIFVSGGTESDNLAIFGVTGAVQEKEGRTGHIITTRIEHHAVLHACMELERRGWDVTYLDVDAHGQISLDAFTRALREDTVLVTMMYANNEVGTILPIADVGREILKWRKEKKTAYPYLHTDACQAASLEVQVEKLHVDLMTCNGSKVYGPKGSGMLYKRRGVPLQPLLYGGGQEMGWRSGTEDVAAIVGFERAFTQAVQYHKEKSPCSEQEVRDYLWERICSDISQVTLNGMPLSGARLCNNVHVTFHGVEAEALLLYLDEYGITVGTGSACATGSDEGSHVLRAMGMQKKDIESSIRFSLGKYTSKDDIDYVMTYLPAVVEQLRKLR